jgi:hypothetical protein
MTTPIVPFIRVEVLHMAWNPPSLNMGARVRIGSVIATVDIVVVVDGAAESFMSMPPGAGANKDAAVEPFRTVVAPRSAVIRCIVVIAVWADGSDAHVDAYLSSISFWGGHREASRGNRDQCKAFEKCLHKILLHRNESGFPVRVVTGQTLLDGSEATYSNSFTFDISDVAPAGESGKYPSELPKMMYVSVQGIFWRY